MTRLAACLIVALVGLSGGCATIHTKVDSIAAPDVTDYRSYVFLSAVEDVGTNDLQFREFASLVEKKLAEQGYTRADSLQAAEIAIFMSYGMSDPVTLPRVVGMLNPSGGGYIGTRYDTLHSRFLRLEAVDIASYQMSQEIKSLWRTTVLSSGSSGDLRYVFPYLVVAAADYVGTNTGKQVSVRLSEGDRRVRRLKEH